jgi:hypothetical protein
MARAVLKRTMGIVLLVAGGAFLLLAAVLVVAVVRAGGTGGDWSVRWLPRAAAAMGLVLGSSGFALLTGRPTGLERRPTNRVVLGAALLLFAVLVVLGLLHR